MRSYLTCAPGATVGILCRQDHSLRQDPFQFAWFEIGYEANLFPGKVFGIIVFCNTADDGALFHAVINKELQELVCFGYTFAFQYGAYTYVNFHEVVERNIWLLWFRLPAFQFVFLAYAAEAV